MCKSTGFVLKFRRISCTMNYSSSEGGVFRGRSNYEIHEIVQQVYDALKEKGYNPVNQLVGYILSEDPTYITTYKNARALIRKVDRDDLLQAMLRNYLNV